MASKNCRWSAIYSSGKPKWLPIPLGNRPKDRGKPARKPKTKKGGGL